MKAVLTPSLRFEPGDTRYNAYPARLKVPLCSPSWRLQDLGRATIAASDVAHAAARAAIREALGVTSPILLTSSGTAALALGLSALRQGSEDEVVVPTFACPGIVEAVLMARMRPVLCDVAEDGVAGVDEVASRIGRHTRAVVVAHVLGAAADTPGLERLCLDAGIFLIDDAAQALGASVGDRRLGTYGNLGVLSFGRHKPVYAGGGGALIVTDATLARRLDRLAQDLPAQESPRGQTLRTYVMSRFQRVTSMRDKGRHFGDVARAIDAFEAPSAGAMSGLTAALVASELGRLQKRQARIALHLALYAQRLSAVDGPRQTAPKRTAAPTFCTVRIPPEWRHNLSSFLARRGVETTWLYYPLHRIARYACYAEGAYEGAESLWRGLLCLPCRGEHSTRAIRMTADAVCAFVQRSPR